MTIQKTETCSSAATCTHSDCVQFMEKGLKGCTSRFKQKLSLSLKIQKRVLVQTKRRTAAIAKPKIYKQVLTLTCL